MEWEVEVEGCELMEECRYEVLLIVISMISFKFYIIQQYIFNNCQHRINTNVNLTILIFNFHSKFNIHIHKSNINKNDLNTFYFPHHINYFHHSIIPCMQTFLIHT